MNFCRNLLLLAALLPLAAQEPSAYERNHKGWKNLMPKPSLKGWDRAPIPMTAKLSPDTQWKVENGVLICTGDKGHDWLFYKEDYGDFILHVEWRYTKLDGNPRYNSGIFVRTPPDSSSWYQVQIGSSSGGYIFGVQPGEKAPQRFNLQKEMKEQRVKPAGEWNTTEVIAKGKSIQSWINGAVVSELQDCKTPRARIGLEAEGFRIEFRKIFIKPVK